MGTLGFKRMGLGHTGIITGVNVRLIGALKQPEGRSQQQ